MQRLALVGRLLSSAAKADSPERNKTNEIPPEIIFFIIDKLIIIKILLADFDQDIRLKYYSRLWCFYECLEILAATPKPASMVTKEELPKLIKGNGIPVRGISPEMAEILTMA